MAFSAFRFDADELDAAMTPEESSANLSMWLRLDREGLREWYRDLAASEFAIDPLWRRHQ
jgi:hypothetical protein